MSDSARRGCLDECGRAEVVSRGQGWVEPLRFAGGELGMGTGNPRWH